MREPPRVPVLERARPAAGTVLPRRVQTMPQSHHAINGKAMATRKIHSVLFVDDDPDVCEVVQATLRLLAGLQVYIAGSGEQAIDLAYELRPDLVLMDVVMAGLDGPSTLKRMRERAPISEIPVIFLTAKVHPAMVAQLLELGAIGVIGKPFDPLKLCDELLSLWKHAGATREIKRTHAAHSRVQAKVGSLTASFLQRTRDDVLRLRSIVENARHGNQSSLKEIHCVAHSIRGAGTMFGFPELSAAAEVIERLVGEVMAGSKVSRTAREPAVLQRLMDCSAQLARELEAAGQTTHRRAGMFQSLRICR
jgi:two-component system OmpR family response regulator